MDIKIVIGSWGSYNECNERALGSKWLTLSDYSDWEEIEEELKNEGFMLDGIDEELFIQDVDNFPADINNWDCTHPKDFFELLKKSGILDNDIKDEIFNAFLEIESYNEWERLVNEYEENWDQDIYLYKDYDWYDLGYQILHDSYKIPEYLEDYIDYARYGKELHFEGFHEYSNGIIEIRR